MAEMKWINILLIAAVAYMVLGGNLNFGGTQSAVTSQGDGTSAPPIITTSTTYTLVVADELQPGTAVGILSAKASINGAAFSTVTSGTGTVSQGDAMKVIVTNNTYHTAYLSNLIVPSKTTYNIPVNMKANATPTVTMFNTNNLVTTNTATAASGAVNQSVASGGAYNLKIRIDGQDKKSTGAMRCILESSDGTKMDKMILSGLPGATYVGMAKPSFYTLLGSSSQVWVYDINEISGAASPEGTVAVISKTSQSLAATSIKVTCYSKEYFIDSVSGVVGEPAIEDSLGTAQWKSIAAYQMWFH